MRLLDAVSAAGHWRRVDFISDLHLEAGATATFEAWRDYMASTCCNALFILGDLFEVWVGDDLLDDPAEAAFPIACANVLRATAQRMPVYFMAGNRDFLVGSRLLEATGIQGLSDPCTLTLGPEKWVLSHGDALCLDDTAYQSFRRWVRTPEWQTAFLNKPLHQRLEEARSLRTASEARKKSEMVWADASPQAAAELLERNGASRLVHGHTHQPGDHPLENTVTHRSVLSDWDASATPSRLQVLRWLAPDLRQNGEPLRISPKMASSA